MYIKYNVLCIHDTSGRGRLLCRSVGGGEEEEARRPNNNSDTHSSRFPLADPRTRSWTDCVFYISTRPRNPFNHSSLHARCRVTTNNNKTVLQTTCRRRGKRVLPCITFVDPTGSLPSLPLLHIGLRFLFLAQGTYTFWIIFFKHFGYKKVMMI